MSQNKLSHIAFFCTLFKGYKCNKLYEITPKKRSLGSPRKQISNFTGIEKTQAKSSCIRFFRLHSLCLLQGENRIFWQMKVGGGGGLGLLIFFPPLIKKASIILWMFLLKESHLNNSMLEDSLLAYLLYKYTLYRTFIINIKVKCFYYKANIAFKSTHLQVQNFNEISSIFL